MTRNEAAERLFRDSASGLTDRQFRARLRAALTAEREPLLAALHELATASSIMLDSPEYQQANERRLSRATQVARALIEQYGRTEK